MMLWRHSIRRLSKKGNRNTMNRTIENIKNVLEQATQSAERAIDSAKRARATLRLCPLGHLQKDVYQATIRDSYGKLLYYRWVCRRCRNFLDCPPWENLIGNTFGIRERSEQIRDIAVLDSVSCGPS